MSENTESVAEKTEKKPAAPAKPSLARIAVDEVVARVAGLVVDDSATAYTKVAGPSGNKVYIQKRAEVREVHLSGWGKGRVGTVEPPKANGKVEAHLDVADPDALRNLEDILNELAAQPAKTAKEKAPKEPKQPKANKPSKAGDGAKDRLAEIRARAEELGLGKDVKVDSAGEAVDPEAFAAAVDAVAQAEQTEAVDA